MKNLKYPEGSIVSYCDEYYKIITNYNDHSATVMDTAGDVSRNFYFSFCGEDAVLITDEVIINQVNRWINVALDKKGVQ
jgi:hypothetical protein